MGLSCKPMGKLKGLFTKIELEQLKEAKEIKKANGKGKKNKIESNAN